MPDVIKSCRRCQRKFIVTQETQWKASKGSQVALYYCPGCAKQATPEEVEKAVSESQAKDTPVAAPPPRIRPESQPPAAPQRAAPPDAQPPQQRAAQPPRAPLQSLPSTYLQNGYFEGHTLGRWVFADDARDAAEVLGHKGLSAASLRRFYSQLQAIDAQYSQTGDFAAIRPRLYSFRVQAEAAKNRDVVPPAFLDFIDRNLKLAEKDYPGFRGFLEHYQSVVAYAKQDGGPGSSGNQAAPALGSDYLKEGYFTGGNMRKEIFVEYPKMLIEVFRRANPQLTFTGLRRFYNKLKAVQSRARQGGFAAAREGIYAFERDVAYAANRRIVPAEFEVFIRANINLVIADGCPEKALDAFVEHFQAVVAYARGGLKSE